jgi:hypothetical protein
MAITSKIRIARGLISELPAPPNSFEQGRPYFAEDTQELFIGQGISLPMLQVFGSVQGPLTFLGVWADSFDYVLGDVVVFGNNLYAAVQSSTAQEPDLSPSFWSLIVTAQGPPGPQGTQGEPGFGLTGPQGVPGPQGSTQLIAATSYPTTNGVLVPVPINFNSTGNNIVVIGSPSTPTISVYKMVLTTSAATVLTFNNGPTAQSGLLSFNGPAYIVLDQSDKPWYAATGGNNLVINQSASAQVGGTLWVTQE